MGLSEGAGSAGTPPTNGAPQAAHETVVPPGDKVPSVWNRLRDTRRWGGRILALVAALVGLVVVAKIIADRGDWAPVTYGTVLVETPQVYTRERLVNDRLVQESWLREVLSEKQSFSVVVERASVADRRTTTISVAGGGGGDKTDANDKKGDAAIAPPGDRELKFPPALEFNLRNSYREAVRAHLIENQLDDRHDMRGTTLYMFKFDTAVLPGIKTRQPAFVRVAIRHYEEQKSTASSTKKDAAESAPAGKEPDASFRERDTPEKYIRSYINSTYIDAADEWPAASENLKLYLEWVDSLRDRLNAVFWETLSRFNANEFRYADYYQMLQVISERRARELFHSWAGALAKIQTERDDLRLKLKSGVRERTSANAAPSDGESARTTEVEIDHRFHFLSKYVLWKAAAQQRPEPELANIRQMLSGEQPLPGGGEDGVLRDALLSYLVRHAGKFVVGDPSFSLGSFQSTNLPSPAAVISSKTLDGFVYMALVTKGERDLYEIEVKPRYVTLYALGLNASDDDKCKSDAQNSLADLYEPVSAYTAGASRVIPVYHGMTPVEGRLDLGSRGALDPLQEKWLSLIFSRKSPQSDPRLSVQLPEDYRDCFDVAEKRHVPVGYFRFVYGVLDMQTYTYATLPRMDIQIAETSHDQSRDERVSTEIGAIKTGGALGNEYRRIARAFQPKTTVVGFSGYCRPAPADPAGQPSWLSATWRWVKSWWSPVPASRVPPFCDAQPFAADELRFGWVLSPPYETTAERQSLSYGPMHPSQRSLSSLVTVPSWWRRVSVYINTGWINDDGSLITTGEVSYPVTLPIDYEALDAILIGPARRDSHRPTIAIERLPDPMELEACQPAEILIPGRRLWRSTVVVLGGQQAREVLVLPDMRGVIAKFPPISARGTWEDRNGKTERELQVWTSEGRAAAVPVAIKGPLGPCPEQPQGSGRGRDQRAGATEESQPNR